MQMGLVAILVGVVGAFTATAAALRRRAHAGQLPRLGPGRYNDLRPLGGKVSSAAILQ